MKGWRYNLVAMGRLFSRMIRTDIDRVGSSPFAVKQAGYVIAEFIEVETGRDELVRDRNLAFTSRKLAG